MLFDDLFSYSAIGFFDDDETLLSLNNGSALQVVSMMGPLGLLNILGHYAATLCRFADGSISHEFGLLIDEQADDANVLAVLRHGRAMQLVAV